MPLTLEQLNAASPAEALALLDGLYEHSPWIAEQALAQRPFRSLAHLKHALAQVVRTAELDAQLGLIRAHPELAGKAMVAKSLTAESTNEQSKAGLTECTPEEFERIQQLREAGMRSLEFYAAKRLKQLLCACNVGFSNANFALAIIKALV